MTASCPAEPVANYHCRTGENPLWDETRQTLFWTDIPAGRLYRYDTLTGRHGLFYEGEVVGGFTLQTDGSLLLFGVDRICRLLPGMPPHPLCDGIYQQMQRFNDVIADPAGRVFAGTIGKTAESGGLYRVEPDGRITRLFQGTGCANGMGFSPDRRRFYWTCSTSKRIFRFDYDEITGELSNRQVWLDLSAEPGTPDGLTVDAAGCVWSARWGGGGLFRYAPDGRLLERVDLPVANVSSVAFGGRLLDELYITTAGGQDGSEGPEGTLYRVKAPIQGRLEFRSRALLDWVPPSE